MSSPSPSFRFLVFCLALVLAGLTRLAEGFVLYEQREPAEAPLPQLRPDRGQVIISLNGPWEFRVGNKGAFRSGWIPCSFDGSCDEVVFRRSFSLPDSLKSFNIQLHLPEVHHTVEVWVNGAFVSSFTGSQLAFSCLITRDRLRFGGENDLELRVDARLTPRSTFPVRPQLMHPQNYGGVFSGVYLRAVPPWSMEELNLGCDSPLDSSAVNATVKLRIARYRAATWVADSSGASGDVRIHALLRDSTGRTLTEGWSERVASGGSESFLVSVRLPKTAVSLWAPGRPVLYELVATLVAGADTLQRMSRQVGFKNVQIRNGNLYLNGRPLRLRGMDYVPENRDGRRAISRTVLRQDLSRIRELGFNVVRVPFGPPPLPLLDLADQMGLMVLAESNLDWIPGEILIRPAYRDMVEHAVTRLLAVAGDHPSVLAWGLGSQLDWRRQATRDFSLWLRGLVKERDSRPCYIETGRPEFTDGLADMVLVSQPWCGDGSVASLPRGNVPTVLSRVGALAAAGGRNPSGMPSGAVEQAEYLLHQLSMFDANPSVDGFLLHSFADYHGSSPLLSQPGVYDPSLYTFGIMSWDRQERVAYAKLRDLAQTGQSSPPAPSPAKSGPPVAFPVVGLGALLFLSLEMRRNNVFRQNLKRAFLHAHGFYSDLRYRRFLHIGQPLVLWILEAVTFAVLVSSALYSLRASFALDYYLTHFLPWPQLKIWLVDMIWAPAPAIAYFTVLFMVAVVFKILVVRLLSFLFRERVDFWQSANYVIWSLAAILFLLPLAVVFYRVIEMSTLATVAYLAVAAGLIWCVVRLLSALRAGFAASPLRVYGTVVGIVALLIVVILAVLDNRLGTMTYLPFFQDVFVAR